MSAKNDFVTQRFPGSVLADRSNKRSLAQSHYPNDSSQMSDLRLATLFLEADPCDSNSLRQAFRPTEKDGDELESGLAESWPTRRKTRQSNSMRYFPR